MQNREKFASRLGFILISAGCAIGLGNVWRFPYITGQYGGAAFVLIYLLFLIILGMPIMVMEFAVGRASQKSAARSFHVLEPKGTKWHLISYLAIAGNYLLMMFYTGNPQCNAGRRRSRHRILPGSRLWPYAGSRPWRSYICRYGTSVLYAEFGYRRAGYLWQLYQQRPLSDRRSGQRLRIGYLGGIFVRFNHLSCLLCLRY